MLRRILALVPLVSLLGIPTFAQAFGWIDSQKACARSKYSCCCHKDGDGRSSTLQAEKHCCGSQYAGFAGDRGLRSATNRRGIHFRDRFRSFPGGNFVLSRDVGAVPLPETSPFLYSLAAFVSVL